MLAPCGKNGAQVKTIWYTGLASFCWSCVRWLFSRDGVPGCGGFEMMPTFGYAALRQVYPVANPSYCCVKSSRLL